MKFKSLFESAPSFRGIFRNVMESLEEAGTDAVLAALGEQKANPFSLTNRNTLSDTLQLQVFVEDAVNAEGKTVGIPDFKMKSLKTYPFYPIKGWSGDYGTSAVSNARRGFMRASRFTDLKDPMIWELVNENGGVKPYGVILLQNSYKGSEEEFDSTLGGDENYGMFTQNSHTNSNQYVNLNNASYIAQQVLSVDDNGELYLDPDKKSDVVIVPGVNKSKPGVLKKVDKNFIESKLMHYAGMFDADDTAVQRFIDNEIINKIKAKIATPGHKVQQRGYDESDAESSRTKYNPHYCEFLNIKGFPTEWNGQTEYRIRIWLTKLAKQGRLADFVLKYILPMDPEYSYYIDKNAQVSDEDMRVYNALLHAVGNRMKDAVPEVAFQTRDDNTIDQTPISSSEALGSLLDEIWNKNGRNTITFITDQSKNTKLHGQATTHDKGRFRSFITVNSEASNRKTDTFDFSPIFQRWNTILDQNAPQRFEVKHIVLDERAYVKDEADEETYHARFSPSHLLDNYESSNPEGPSYTAHYDLILMKHPETGKVFIFGGYDDGKAPTDKKIPVSDIEAYNYRTFLENGKLAKVSTTGGSSGQNDYSQKYYGNDGVGSNVNIPYDGNQLESPHEDEDKL